MKIKAFRDRCISSGNCVQAAPHLFAQDAEGAVVARVTDPPARDHADARKAAAACPVAAIALEDAENR
jgi:ferredoxin